MSSRALLAASCLFLTSVALAAPDPRMPNVAGENRESPDYQMLIAAREGRLAAVKSFLSQGADLYGYDRLNMNVLSHAIAGQQFAVADYLLNEAKFDVTRAIKFGAKDKDESLAYLDQAGAPALAMAAAVGRVELVEQLLKRGVAAEPNERCVADLRPLVQAASNRHREIAKALLGADVHPTWGSVNGLTPAQLFLEQRDLELLNLCYDRARLDLEYVYSTGDTMLALAVKAGWEEGARMLINRGASPYHLNLEQKSAFDLTDNVALRDLMLKTAMERDSDGSKTATTAINLFRAILRNDVAAALDRCDARALNFQDRFGRTPLVFALYLGHEDSAAQILHRRPDVNVVAQSGSALGWACDRKMTGLAEELLRQGADAERAPTEGNTAFEVAALRGETRLVELMLKAGAKVDTPRSSQRTRHRTALMCAAMSGSLDTVKVLLAAKANVDEVDQDRASVLDYAVLSDNPEIIQLLLDAGATKDYTDANGWNAASIAMLRGKLNALRKLNDIGLRDEATAAKVFTDPMTSKELLQFLKRYYQKDANEAAFWAAPHTVEEVQRYLDSGGNVNFAGERTPLQAALHAGSFPLVRVLLERGAAPSAVGTSPEHYPLEIAASDYMITPHNDIERAEIVALLLKNGADPNVFRAPSPAMLGAVEKGYLRVAKALIIAGADPLAKSETGEGLPEFLGKNPGLSPMEKMKFEMETGSYYQKALQAKPAKPPVKM